MRSHRPVVIRTPLTPMFGVSAMFSIGGASVITSTPTSFTGPTNSFDFEFTEPQNLDLCYADGMRDNRFVAPYEHAAHAESLMSDETTIEDQDLHQIYAPESSGVVFTLNKQDSELDRMLPPLYDWVNQKPLRLSAMQNNPPDQFEIPTIEDGVVKAVQDPIGFSVPKPCEPIVLAPETEVETEPQAPKVIDEDGFKKVLKKRKLTKFQRRCVGETSLRRNKWMAKKGTVTCPVASCCKVFSSMGFFAFHYEDHDAEDKRKVSFCKHKDCPYKVIGFSSPSSLSRHVASIHTMKKLSCDRCQMAFSRPDSLRKHKFRNTQCEIKNSGTEIDTVNSIFDKVAEKTLTL